MRLGTMLLMRRKFWLKFYDKINVNSAKKLKKEDTLKTPSTVPHFDVVTLL